MAIAVTSDLKLIIRKLNFGVNPITASVRAAFGTAHQVGIWSQHKGFFLHKVGMNSSNQQLLQDKKKFVKEVIEVL